MTTGSGRWPQPAVLGDTVSIPYRIYNPEPAPGALDALTEDERTVLGCWYTRHHDGHVRQRWLASVLASTAAWTAPYVVQLCGEYVVEICEDIAAFTLECLPAVPGMQKAYTDFFEANTAVIRLTRQRATSYWNEYHRSVYVEPSTYPGLLALNSLSGIDVR